MFSRILVILFILFCNVNSLAHDHTMHEKLSLLSQEELKDKQLVEKLFLETCNNYFKVEEVSNNAEVSYYSNKSG